MKTEIIERPITEKCNTFKIPAAEWANYMEIVVITHDEETRHSARMSFLRKVPTELKDSPVILACIKNCVDMTRGSVLQYLKSKQKRQSEQHSKDSAHVDGDNKQN